MWMKANGLRPADRRVAVNALFAVVLAADALSVPRTLGSREYFVEIIEHMTNRSLNPTAYPSVSFDPMRRFASAGCVSPEDARRARRGVQKGRRMARSQVVASALAAALSVVAMAAPSAQSQAGRAAAPAARPFEAVLPRIAATAPGTYVVNDAMLTPAPEAARIPVMVQADVLRGPERRPARRYRRRRRGAAGGRRPTAGVDRGGGTGSRPRGGGCGWLGDDRARCDSSASSAWRPATTTSRPSSVTPRPAAG